MEFKYANTSEVGGIPSSAVKQFFNKIQAKGINLHSIMMLRGDTVLVEAYYAPYQKDSTHRIYSITKTVTSLAIGLLIEEGKIQLNDKICKYFPEKLSNQVDKRIQNIRIEDMLKMATAHQSTTYKRYDGDWVESFFHVKPTHEPGCVFHYDTSAVHVLSALVEKLTGKSMLTYLREKSFDKLGISKEAYILEDPYGIQQGGSGMVCTTEDMAKIAYLCTHYGYVDGEQIYPEDYLRKATSKQISTRVQPLQDEQYGYGYYVWQSRDNKGFCLYGMGGQLALCFPKYDFILVTTADMQGTGSGLQTLYDSFYDTIFPYVEKTQEDEVLPINLQEMSISHNMKLKRMDGSLESSRLYQKMCQEGINLNCQENPQGIKSLYIDVDSETSSGTLKYEKRNETYTIPFSFKEYIPYIFEDNKALPKEGRLAKVQAMTMATMETEYQLLLRTYLLGDYQANFWIEIGFSKEDGCATVRMKKAAENFLIDYDGVIGCQAY